MTIDVAYHRAALPPPLPSGARVATARALFPDDEAFVARCVQHRRCNARQFFSLPQNAAHNARGNGRIRWLIVGTCRKSTDRGCLERVRRERDKFVKATRAIVRTLCRLGPCYSGTRRIFTWVKRATLDNGEA